MKPIVVVLLAVLVPVLWGIGSAWVFDRLRMRRERSLHGQAVPRDGRHR